MWTIFGILKPGSGPERLADGPQPVLQKPFFSQPDETDLPTRGEREAAVLSGKAPASLERDDDPDETVRFVRLFSPPYF